MNDLERIKAKIDIVDFIGDYITLKKGGRNFKALCPFHGEKTPSFYVSPERQTWHCFGACNEGGDIFDFLVKWDHVDFSESIKILAEKAGVQLSSYKPSPEEESKERLYEINHLASEFFHFLLKNHNVGENARDYIKKRGTNSKIVDTFMLGYAPNAWDGLLKYLRKKGYKDDEIIKTGLAIKSERGSVYDRFRSRLMFTLCDQRGKIIGFSGRKLGQDTDKEAKYINTPETPLYIKGNVFYGLDKTKESIKKEKFAIVVEGEFDFLSSFQNGVSNIVAIKGSAFTDAQINLLKRFTDTIYLALDSDFAGNEAAKKGIENAENAGLTIKVIKLEYGKDPDECIQKSPALWKKSIQNAENIYDFLIERALQMYSSTDAGEKKKIGDEVIPFIAKISNPIIYSHYQRLLATKLSVSEDAIASLVEREKLKKTLGTKTNTKFIEKKNIPREELLEEHLLSLLLSSSSQKKETEYITSILGASDFVTVPIARIIEELKKYFIKHDELDMKIFSKVLTPEIAPIFDKAYLKELDEYKKDKELYEGELKKTVKEIKKGSLRRRVNEITTKLEVEDDEKTRNDLKETIEKIGLIDREKV